MKTSTSSTLAPTDVEFATACERAARKLEFIVSRYGDANGERRKPQYLAQLIAEAIGAERLRDHLASLYEEKRKDCP